LPITVVEWTGPTPPAVVGWVFVAMLDSGQWRDLHLHVHEGQSNRGCGPVTGPPKPAVLDPDDGDQAPVKHEVRRAYLKWAEGFHRRETSPLTAERGDR
jgi:hypothetical protein